eukprot:2737542-Prymnesium_polylepis.1
MKRPRRRRTGCGERRAPAAAVRSSAVSTQPGFAMPKPPPTPTTKRLVRDLMDGQGVSRPTGREARHMPMTRWDDATYPTVSAMAPCPAQLACGWSPRPATRARTSWGRLGQRSSHAEAMSALNNTSH